MSSDKELYVSIGPQVYVSGKSNGLIAQSNLLKIMKGIHNLKVLSRQKREYKDRLFKLFEAVVKEVKKIEEKFPRPEIPNDIKRKIKQISSNIQEDLVTVETKSKRDYSKRDEIDSELFEIQRKLSSLNS